MSAHKVSVIVSSYNQPRSLRLALAGFAGQTDTDFDLTVADDGSRDNVRLLVEEFAAGAPFPVRFMTQPDEGFRKGRIHNDAVMATRGDQLIFCDGDCIPVSNFVAVHRAHYRPGTFCAGGRVVLTPEQSRELTPEAVAAGDYERLLTPAWRLSLRWVHWKNILYRTVGMRYKPKMLGCNWSVDRGVLLEVDGFDEMFNQMSGYDSDVRNRLRNLGAPGISLWDKAFVLHLNHSLDPERYAFGGSRKRKDRELYEGSRKRVKAMKGISSRDATRTAEERGP